MKNTHGGRLILVKFTKINTPPWVFFTSFKFYKCYQIAQRATFNCFVVTFFCSSFVDSKQNITKLRKLFNWNHRLDWNTAPQIYILHLIFLSAFAVMQVIFWTEDICSFISYYWNSFSLKLKKLINKQAFSIAHQIQFIRLRNAFKAPFFHWYVFPFQLVQSTNAEFLFNKDTSKRNPYKAGLFEGNFFWGEGGGVSLTAHSSDFKKN